MGQGSNSLRLRRYNERVVLTTLRSMQSASKSDLARSSRLTPQAATRIVDELEASGLVHKKGRRLGGKGQPSTMYAINPTGAYSIGVKVGRRDLEMLLMDFGGEVLEKIVHEFDVPEPSFLLDKIDQGIRDLDARVTGKSREKLLGVGVAMPWFIGSWTEELNMTTDQAEEWNKVNFGEEIAKRTSLPVHFENDCSAAATAELVFGRGQQVGNFLYIYVGTIVGGGVVQNGSLLPGVHGNAGAIASMPVPPSKIHRPEHWTEEYDLLYNRASLFELRQYLVKNGCAIQNIADLPTVIDDARSLIQDWLSDCSDALAIAALAAASLLDLEAVIIESTLPRHLLEELVSIVSRRLQSSMPPEIFPPDVLAGTIGVDAVAIGGAILPFYAHFAPDKTVLLKGGVPARSIGR